MRLVWPTRSAPWCSARQTYLFEWPVPLGTDSSGMSDPLLAGTHRRVEEVTNWPYLDMMEAWWTPPLTPVHETSKKAQITGRHFMILWIQSSSLFGASPTQIPAWSRISRCRLKKKIYRRRCCCTSRLKSSAQAVQHSPGLSSQHF